MRQIKFRAWDFGKEHKVETVDEPVDGRGAHNFKGFEISGGYVLRKVRNHPRSNIRGYYPEHRLVMEESLGRFLSTEEVVHHKDGNRKNNQIDNLKIVTQSEHAGMEHVGKRNPNGTMAAADPIFDQIKFRLHNVDTGVTSIFTLSKLIGTTFRRGKFEFRGRWTGLHDKNGKEIWEGDILKGRGFCGIFMRKDCLWIVGWKKGAFCLESTSDGVWREAFMCDNESRDDVVIGNIYENPELLK